MTRPVLIHIDEDGIVGRQTLTAIQKVLRHVNVEEQAVHLICERRRNFINSRVERGIIKAKFHRGLLKRVDYIEGMQRWEL